MRNWLDDFRYATRGLRRAPGFAIAAILVLALGIGANTAIFSIVNAVLLRPLPFQDSSRIVQVWHVPPAKSFPGLRLFSVSPANYLDWKRESTSFDSMAAYRFRSFTIGGKDQPEAVPGSAVEPEFFSVLRVRPMLGRTFAPEENIAGQDRVILLSYKFWRDRLASDSDVVNRKITVNSEDFSIVGVMPQNFALPDRAQVWVPLAWSNEERAVRGQS